MAGANNKVQEVEYLLQRARGFLITLSWVAGLMGVISICAMFLVCILRRWDLAFVMRLGVLFSTLWPPPFLILRGFALKRFREQLEWYGVEEDPSFYVAVKRRNPQAANFLAEICHLPEAFICQADDFPVESESS